jgi:hypothetical protein
MVPTDYVVLPSNGSWRIDTASPLPRPVARYRDALMATVSGRFPPNRTENVCAPGQAPQQHPPYLLILGASHSGTGAIANLLQGLGVLLSHEHVSRVYITKGGLSSWISTVKGERTFLHNGRDLEPRCKRTVTLLQVRAPPRRQPPGPGRPALRTPCAKGETSTQRAS